MIRSTFGCRTLHANAGPQPGIPAGCTSCLLRALIELFLSSISSGPLCLYSSPIFVALAQPQLSVYASLPFTFRGVPWHTPHASLRPAGIIRRLSRVNLRRRTQLLRGIFRTKNLDDILAAAQ